MCLCDIPCCSHITAPMVPEKIRKINNELNYIIYQKCLMNIIFSLIFFFCSDSFSRDSFNVQQTSNRIINQLGSIKSKTFHIYNITSNTQKISCQIPKRLAAMSFVQTSKQHMKLKFNINLNTKQYPRCIPVQCDVTHNTSSIYWKVWNMHFTDIFFFLIT